MGWYCDWCGRSCGCTHPGNFVGAGAASSRFFSGWWYSDAPTICERPKRVVDKAWRWFDRFRKWPELSVWLRRVDAAPPRRSLFGMAALQAYRRKRRAWINEFRKAI